MPPPVHLLKKPARKRLARCRWRNLAERLKRERSSFATPLNDLSFEDREVRVRILQSSAYHMGRRDARDTFNLEHPELAAANRKRLKALKGMHPLAKARRARSR